mgnify:FL=1
MSVQHYVKAWAVVAAVSPQPGRELRERARAELSKESPDLEFVCISTEYGGLASVAEASER